MQSEWIRCMTLTFQLFSTPMQYDHRHTFQVKGHIFDHCCAWQCKISRCGEWDSIIICICCANLQLVAFGSGSCAVFPFLCIKEPGQEKELLFFSCHLPLWFLLLAVLWSAFLKVKKLQSKFTTLVTNTNDRSLFHPSLKGKLMQDFLKSLKKWRNW